MIIILIVAAIWTIKILHGHKKVSNLHKSSMKSKILKYDGNSVILKNSRRKKII